MGNIKKLAGNAGKDETLLAFFKIKNEYYSLMKDGEIPSNLKQKIDELKFHINNYYLQNYQNFYDILFINKEGEVIYTIRKENDYHKNIFEEELQTTELSKKLKENPTESYVDFLFYRVSGEPSAFFIEPVMENNRTAGWIVLQHTVNKINSLFSQSENLGKTGEVVMVNEDHFLLTNSRFYVEPTILKQQLPDENIDSKFIAGKGQKLVTDYRNKQAYSVFEVFPFLESKWLIIAKIDKSEIVTDYYRENSEDLYPLIINPIEQKKNYYLKDIQFPDNVLSVQMDEFKRGDNSSDLFTRGVATCTAVNIIYPEKFSYLAHISPYDRIYKETGTDLINQILKHISYFDITQSNMENIVFRTMSTQINSLETLINVIIENDYFLNQIFFSFNPNAKYGDLYSSSGQNKTIVRWNMENETLYQDFENIESIEDILLSQIE